MTPPEPVMECKDAKEKIDSDEYCGYIMSKSSPFKTCIEELKKDAFNPAESFDNCRYDMCAIWDKSTDAERKEEACTALAEIDELCAQAGVSVKWRTNSFCRKLLSFDTLFYVNLFLVYCIDIA